MKNIILIYILSLITLSCSQAKHELAEISQWTTIEINLFSEKVYTDAYTKVDVWASFVSSRGDTLLRPAFWDGGNNWKVRFVPVDTGSVWRWMTFSSANDKGLSGQFQDT